MNGLMLTEKGLSTLQQRLKLMSDEQIHDIVNNSKSDIITVKYFSFICTRDSLISLKDPRIMKIFFKNYSSDFIALFYDFSKTTGYFESFLLDPEPPDWARKNYPLWKPFITRENQLTEAGRAIRDYLFGKIGLKTYASPNKIEVIFTELQREMTPIYMMGHVTPDKILTKDKVNVLASYEVKNDFEMYKVIHEYITQ